MQVIHHIGLRLENEEERKEFQSIGINLEPGVKMPGGGVVTGVDIAEDHPSWERLAKLLNKRKTVDLVFPKFTPAELDSAKFLRILPKSLRGYPQPEDRGGYLTATFDLSGYCVRCGVGKKQVRPFRLKSSLALKDTSFLQLNWVFDEIFVTRATWEAVFKPIGVSNQPVVLHKTGAELESVVQLDIPGTCDLKVDGLPFEQCPVCGRNKYSPVRRGFLPEPIAPDALIFKSAQWFQGITPTKMIIVSSVVYRRIKEAGFTEVEFYACAGQSS